MNNDGLFLYDREYKSRFLLGTALYPSPKIMSDSVKAAEANIVTVSLRRENSLDNDGKEFYKIIKDLNIDVLPNTAGCYGVKEAVNTAYMARELFGTKFIKLEVIGDSGTLQPNPLLTIEAAKILCDDGFQVFPYIIDDLIICDKLVSLGCKVIMPWAAPIGTALGIQNPYSLKRMREHFPDIKLIIDAGIGLPSHATQVMEMGFDAILLNTAVAKAGDPVLMAEAFKDSINAGRKAFLSSPMPPRNDASPSTPEFGTAFSPFSS